MRIAFDCTHHQYPGGVRVYIERLLEALTASDPELELLLHYRGRSHPRELPSVAQDGHRVVHTRAPRRLLSSLENRIGWPAIERWTGPLDVFHGPHFWLPVARRGRLVLTVHDVAYLKHPDLYENTRLNEYGYRHLLANSLRRADAVIVPCEHTRRDLIELFDTPEDQLWVVPFGSDPGLSQLPVAEQRQVLTRLGVDRPFVVFPVGTFEPRKNLVRALEAFALAFPFRDDRPLLFVTGVGGIPAAARQMITTLGLERDVRIETVGYPEDLRALLSAAIWGLYPSLYEGFGLPALEALRCGLPLLVGDSSSLPEVVGDAALLVDPTDSEALAEGMRVLHDQELLREQLGESGRRRASDPAWSWQRCARQTLAAYRNDRPAYDDEPQPLAHAARGGHSPVTTLTASAGILSSRPDATKEPQERLPAWQIRRTR